MPHDLEKTPYSSLFNTSSQLQINWLTQEVVVHDFAPGHNFFVSIPHAHPYLELLVVASGEGQLFVEAEPPVPLCTGSLIFLNQGVAHKLVSMPEQPLHTYLLSFSLIPRPVSEKVAQEWVEDERRVVDAALQIGYQVIQDDGSCIHEIQHIEGAATTHKLGELVIIKGYISNFIMFAFQQFTQLPVRNDFEDTLTTTPTLSTSRIINYIQAHFTENISISTVSEALHYSQRQCQRVIRHNLGISFTDLLTDMRLSYGKELLYTTDYSVEIIAELAGFKSGKSFSRILREWDGITPYRYRKAHRKKTPPLDNTEAGQPSSP